ncbi:MAG: hypothetical protein Q4F29_13300, partial [Lachnospiraceae bacterium]|nr:hypothetical protein [Lachnospiraceae bacterium]
MSINELGKENMEGQNDKAAAEAAKDGAPKKKVVAVYRPQNSQQIKNRPAPQRPRTEAAPAEAPKAAEKPAEAKENTGARSGYQGNRDSRGDGQRGGYQGPLDNLGAGRRGGS